MLNTSRGRSVQSEFAVNTTPVCGTSDRLDDLSSVVFIQEMIKAANAVQIKVSIDEIEPGVWRRLVLPVYWNLEHLHLGIQAAFNWWNYHLYAFRIGGLRYGDVEILTEDATDDDPRVFDQSEVRLLDFEQGSVFSYHYDFGTTGDIPLWSRSSSRSPLRPNTGAASLAKGHDRPKMLAACRDMSGSWRSSPIGTIPNTRKPSGGAVDILIRDGSTFRSWTRTSAMLCARTSSGVHISRSRNLSQRNELARSKVSA